MAQLELDIVSAFLEGQAVPSESGVIKSHGTQLDLGEKPYSPPQAEEIFYTAKGLKMIEEDQMRNKPTPVLSRLITNFARGK